MSDLLSHNDAISRGADEGHPVAKQHLQADRAALGRWLHGAHHAAAAILASYPRHHVSQLASVSELPRLGLNVDINDVYGLGVQVTVRAKAFIDFDDFIVSTLF
jgi:hypothetical protein